MSVWTGEIPFGFSTTKSTLGLRLIIKNHKISPAQVRLFEAFVVVVVVVVVVDFGRLALFFLQSHDSRETTIANI